MTILTAIHIEPTDGELAQAWQRGDRRAGSVLIDRHLPRLRAFLRGRCGESADADDLAQEVFLAVCRNLSNYDPSLAFAGWLHGIARMKLADFWRHRRPEQPLETHHEGVEHRSPASLHEAADEGAAAWATVFARLPKAQASALWLRVQEELSVEEIARVMDVSLPNAKVLLFRARQTLTPIFRPRPTPLLAP